MIGRTIKSGIAAIKHRKMYKAMQKNNMNVINELVTEFQADADFLNYSYENTETLLAYALRHRKADLALRLLRLRYTSLPKFSTPAEVVNARKENGELFLEWAIDTLSTNEVIELVGMPCFDINLQNRCGNPLLFDVVRRENEKDGTDVLRACLKRADLNPDLNGKDDTILTAAARHGRSIDFMKMLLQDKRVTITKLSPDSKKSPLAEAAAKEQTRELALFLLKQEGCDILQTDAFGNSPLCIACKRADEVLVTEMLNSFGVELKCTHPQVIKAVKLSRNNANLKILKLFVDLNLNTHVNLLHFLYTHEVDVHSVRTVSDLIKQILHQDDFHPYRKFKVRAPNGTRTEYNYVTYALTQLDYKLVCDLIYKLALVQASPQEHLQAFWAMARSFKSDTSVIVCLKKMIATFNLDVNALDENHDTALHHAARVANGHYFISHAIQTLRANPNLKNLKGEAPLHTAILCGVESSIRKLMYSQGVDINVCTVPGNKTPLMLLLENRVALKRRANKVVDILQNDEQISCIDNLIIEILGNEHSNLAIKDANQRSIIFYAADAGRYSFIQDMLRKMPALFQEKDVDGNTVLHHLVRMEDNIQHLKELVVLGGDVRVVNHHGESLYNVALAAGHQNVANYLFKIAPELAVTHSTRCVM